MSPRPFKSLAVGIVLGLAALGTSGHRFEAVGMPPYPGDDWNRHRVSKRLVPMAVGDWLAAELNVRVFIFEALKSLAFQWGKAANTARVQ